ncbi:MAG TPA: DUF4912 domain-containing protein [Desulfotomaculum sp.]|nr:DUF4912 domain-containing protein [Desulfotomaculum sp.]
MEALAWITGLILLAITTAVFLWFLRRCVKKRGIPTERPQEMADTEFSTEISPTVPAQPVPAGEPVPELPHRYQEDRLVLLARDPRWLFAYWEVSATKQEEFASRYGPEAWHSSHSVLRLYDVTGVEFQGNNANTYVDIPINDESESWYIEAGQPNRTFCVDLGKVLPTGQFVTLLRSNLAHTPSGGLSECCDEEWMWLEGIYRSLLRYEFGVSSPLLLEEVSARMGKEFVPIGVASPVGIASPVKLPPEQGPGARY